MTFSSSLMLGICGWVGDELEEGEVQGAHVHLTTLSHMQTALVLMLACAMLPCHHCSGTTRADLDYILNILLFSNFESIKAFPSMSIELPDM